MTLPLAARVETSLPASKTGSASSTPSGSSPVRRRSRSSLRSGFAAAQASKPLLPLGVLLGAALDGLAGVRDDLGVDLEGLLGVEAENLLDGGELVGAERGAVDLAGVLLLRGRPADDRLEDDQRRLVGDAPAPPRSRRAARCTSSLVHARLLPVDDLHVPVVRLVARLHVLGEGDVGVVLDRDLVAVVDRDEVAELLVAGERGGLAGDALLQVAVAGDHVDEVVERARAGLGIRVEQAALEAAGVGEADGGGDALAERAGGDLDAVGVAVLRVAGSQRAPGAQRLRGRRARGRSRRSRAGCTGSASCGRPTG